MMKNKILLFILFFHAAFSMIGQDVGPIDGLDLEFIPNTGSIKWNTKVIVYEDNTYNSFFRRTHGWNGGDGVYSTALPDGNTFWSFGDSFFGEVTPVRNRNKPNNFPRNAAMIQTGETFNSFVTLNEIISIIPESSNYYKAKTWQRHPEGSKTEAQINNGEIDQNMLYWPADATVYEDTLQVIWGQVNNDMVRTETGYAEYSLKGTPGDEEYMKQTKFVRFFRPYTTNYGSGIWEDNDGHTYLYGNRKQCPVVARTETHDLKSKWTYYIRTSTNPDVWVWQEKEPTPDEMNNSLISPHWIAEPNVFKYLDNKYYMVGQEGGYGRQIYIWQSDYPWGPFKDRKILYATPPEHGTTYNAFLHPQFSKKGELMISYNASPDEAMGGFWANFNADGSADLYTPYFVRIFNWQDLYASSAAALSETEALNIYVYPNPVKSKLYLNLPQGTGIDLFTMDGKKVLHSVDNTVDVSSLNKGVYLVYAKMNNIVITEKMIKL